MSPSVSNLTEIHKKKYIRQSVESFTWCEKWKKEKIRKFGVKLILWVNWHFLTPTPQSVML